MTDKGEREYNERCPDCGSDSIVEMAGDWIGNMLRCRECSYAGEPEQFQRMGKVMNEHSLGIIREDLEEWRRLHEKRKEVIIKKQNIVQLSNKLRGEVVSELENEVEKLVHKSREMRKQIEEIEDKYYYDVEVYPFTPFPNYLTRMIEAMEEIDQ